MGVALVVSLLTLFSMMRIWMGVFWSPREEGAPGPPEGALARRPVLMVAPTAVLVACSLAIAVAAGPIYTYSERTARELLDRDSYIDAVLGR